MEKKKTLFDVLGQIFMIFGFSIICIMVFCVLFGQSAQGYSSIFELGNKGITLPILFQYLLTSTIIVLLRQLFCTDVIIKNLSIPLRIGSMFGSVIAVIIVFVWIFDWFPVNDMKPWIMFFVCFVTCAVGSAGVMFLKERAENKKMQEALQRMQEGNEEWSK